MTNPAAPAESALNPSTATQSRPLARDATRTGRVLVLGDNDMASLAIVRSLGRAGLEVHLAAFESKPMTRRSRYVRTIYDLGHPLVETDRFVEGLVAVVKDVGFDLIVPSSDKSLVPMIARRAEIEGLARLAVPDDRGFELTNRKDHTLALAERLGVRIPRTKLLAGTSDLASYAPPVEFPVALKPISSMSPGSAVRHDVRLAKSADELARRLDEMLARSPVLVQEFCRGYGVGLSVLADRGNVIAAFQHRRVHEPPQGGAGSYRVSMPLSAGLLSAARAMCGEIGWTGPAMFEFKVDPKTGVAALMEINGRFWGSLALAVGAGVDFPKLLYDLLVLGRTTEVFQYRVPYFMRHTLRDLAWLPSNLRAPTGRDDTLKVSLPSLVGELRNVLLLREGYDLESLSDPMPGLVGWWWFAKDAASAVRRRLILRRYRRLNARLSERVQRGDAACDARLRQARSILFVCFGNIHRSAVAERRLRDLKSGRQTEIQVASAGILPRSGRPTTELSCDAARELGIDLADHRSQALTREIVARHDLILVMEPDHLRAVRKLDSKALARTLPLAAFDPAGSDGEIPDPHGHDRPFFRETYKRIIACVDELSRRMNPFQRPS